MKSIRDQIRAQLADLKMPGSLEGLDAVLSRVDAYSGRIRPLIPEQAVH